MRRIRALGIGIFLVALVITIVYKVSDKTITDSVPPVITMDSATIELPSAATEEEIMTGVTAEDNRDGDVTDSLVIEKMSNFIEPGRREVTIAAFDSDNNVSKVTRELIYTDYEAPKFYLEEPLRYAINSTASFVSAMTAEDVLDGDLTQNIKISADYKATMDIEGEYAILFTVSNSAGHVSKLPVTVTIYDPAKTSLRPQITLTDYLIHVEQGASVNPWDYVDEVTYRGRVYEPGKDSSGNRILVQDVSGNVTPDYLTDVEVTNDVDTNTPGVYEIIYRITVGEDDDEKETGSMYLIVVVDE